MRDAKKLCSYRLSHDAADMVKLAAKILRRSEGQVVELCVLERLGEILEGQFRRPPELDALVKDINTARDLRAQDAKSALAEARERIRRIKAQS